MMLSIFACVCWSFVHHLWRNVYSSPFPIFELGCFVVELLVFLKKNFFILTWGHFFSLLLEGWGRQKKKETSVWARNIDWLPSCTRTDWGLNQQPEYVPWLGIESMTFWSMGWYSNQLSHTGEGELLVFSDSVFFSFIYYHYPLFKKSYYTQYISCICYWVTKYPKV